MTARSVLGGEDSIMSKIHVSEDLLPPPEFISMCKDFLKRQDENPECEMIDYHEFGKTWLPLFNYDSHEDLQNIPIMDWVHNVSKSPYRPVKLMKYVDGQYRQIALIPPIFDNEAQIIKSPDRDYFGQVAAFKSAEMVHANRLNEANGFLYRNFGKRIEDPKYRLNKHILAMNEIFKLYGFERRLPDWLTNSPSEDVKDVKQPQPKQLSSCAGMLEDDD